MLYTPLLSRKIVGNRSQLTVLTYEKLLGCFRGVIDGVFL